ncbi:MAG: hypothetical protein A2315_12380 [Ignavibacteria bacterium RIFOXYB2_FULL_35_12]|nr:MAG: hypothetical protein A2006_05815 [Ignavibacteria bacterium GWC2_35_8]OGU60461.1 MAG: hypothetical protein A2X60_03045 [Ignavibacteria bacterium GWF2_35_20]OGU83735.1 MAG: hypothetical protein A2254_07550 [Ignavibacteria bacterium RIFOXYA2_FULL_35_9]OGU84567.1 MAG: hypothetical protein A3K31_09020 [Ignavibacteria bacterium RIFOXYA12_FULL_35_25]OGU96837.1 MAG: hypothetical protein A2347_14385 [Ignavibacteria bacterium RIFOXYB12_FULL_35_14]OGV01325.1 MAG: hypothetical protein A2455_04695 
MVNNSPKACTEKKESESLDKIIIYQRERIAALLKKRKELLEERDQLSLCKLLLLLKRINDKK